MKLCKMIEIYLKYDNIHTIGVINAFICINNHVNSCIKCMLLPPDRNFVRTPFFLLLFSLILLFLSPSHAFSLLPSLPLPLFATYALPTLTSIFSCTPLLSLLRCRNPLHSLLLSFSIFLLSSKFPFPVIQNKLSSKIFSQSPTNFLYRFVHCCFRSL